jgi:hypothetical protein
MSQGQRPVIIINHWTAPNSSEWTEKSPNATLLRDFVSVSEDILSLY